MLILHDSQPCSVSDRIQTLKCIFDNRLFFVIRLSTNGEWGTDVKLKALLGPVWSEAINFTLQPWLVPHWAHLGPATCCCILHRAIYVIIYDPDQISARCLKVLSPKTHQLSAILHNRKCGSEEQTALTPCQNTAE